MGSSFYGLILLGFTFGVVAVFTVEAIALLWIIKRLRHTHSSQTQVLCTSSTDQLDHQQSLHFAFQKQVHSCFCLLCLNIQMTILILI